MPTYEFFNHPRFRHLASLLRDVGPKELVYGHVARLEAYLASQGEDPELMAGNVSALSDEQIEHAANWFVPPGRFVAALLKSGLLQPRADGTRFLRGWERHAPSYVKRRIKNGRCRLAEDKQPSLFFGASEKSQSQRGEESADTDRALPPFLSESAESAHSERERSESCEQGCSDAADTEHWSNGPSRRTTEAIVRLLQRQELTPEGLREYGPMGVSVLLAGVGIDDAGFRAAVGKALAFNGAFLADVIELAGMLEARRGSIANPGAWLRTSLAKRGLRV